ncbi:hypothetical protein Vafri_14172 [Volvox africanus]|uniref:Uncharacterized protein n=1 Tax=Volvox africanus TaxID=51714 RepID=A0A8J4BDT7_9CHLO|nr:hypothetical protein Vafri_14172 [Volvox africanus]
MTTPTRPSLQAAKDDRKRTAVVEFCRTSDADYAYRKAHGVRMDGRRWDVRWATREDFRDFGWKWTEGGYDSDEDERDTIQYNNNTTSPITRERSRSPRGTQPTPRGRMSPSPDRSGSPR